MTTFPKLIEIQTTDLTFPEVSLFQIVIERFGNRINGSKEKLFKAKVFDYLKKYQYVS